MKFSLPLFSKKYNQKFGFTLLELLVVFSVVGVLAGSGFASFVSYSKKQVLDQQAADIKTGIDQAKFSAISRVKPTVSPCSASTPLSRYRIRICSSGVACSSANNLYEIDAACSVNGNLRWTNTLISKKRNSTLTSSIASAECGISSGTVMQFSVLNGIDAPCRIVLTDGISSRTVCVDGGGNTVIKDGSVSCGAAYLATTPVPTNPPITLLPTPTTLPDPPTISSQTVTNIAGTSATLNSTVNPNRGQTSITYRYDSSNGICSALSLTLAGPSISGSSNVAPNATNLSSLTGNTIYYYCATADNTSVGGGLTQGIGQGDTSNNQASNFLTAPGVPTITSVGSATLTSLGVSWSAPSPLGSGGAVTYNVYACNRNSSPGCTPGGVSDTPVATSLSSTSYTHPSLVCNTTYAYVVKAVNASGTSASSNIVTGSTSWCDKPTVTTNAATATSATNAQLQSTVNPNNVATTVYYAYSTVSKPDCPTLIASGATIAPSSGISIGGGSIAVNPNTTNVTLTTGAQYYYCAYATNSIGTGYGAVNSVSICYRDADGDGQGSPSGPFGTCGSAGTYVTNNNDCDDANAAIVLNSTRTMWQQVSNACGAGYNSCNSQTQTCTAGGVWSPNTFTSASCTPTTLTWYKAATNPTCGVYGSLSTSRTCQPGGAWSGDTTYTSLSPYTATSQTMYQSSNPSCPSSCVSQFETCTSSGWNGPYTATSCTPPPAPTTCYIDNDHDGERANATPYSFCGGCPYGYTANTAYVDCYDGNALANHSQAGWFSALTSGSAGRGDNSWDFNCSGYQDQQYVGTSTLPAPYNTCRSYPSGTVGWSGSTCACGGYCTKVVCGAFASAGCGTWSQAAVSYNFGASCYSGYAGYAVGTDYASYDPQGGNLYQACH